MCGAIPVAFGSVVLGDVPHRIRKLGDGRIFRQRERRASSQYGLKRSRILETGEDNHLNRRKMKPYRAGQLRKVKMGQPGIQQNDVRMQPFA